MLLALAAALLGFAGSELGKYMDRRRRRAGKRRTRITDASGPVRDGDKR